MRGPPAGRDVVVGLDDVAVDDRLDLVPAGPRGDGLGRLLAALRVREDDEVGALRDDVLAAELRVAARVGVGGRVGDVHEPEQLVDAADERVRGGREEVGAELVVDGRARSAGSRCGQLGDLDLHRLDHGLRALDVPGGLAQRLDLLVRSVEIRRRVLEQDGDVERLQPLHEPARVVGGDDEVRLVAGDRLDVRLEAGEVGHRRLGRVVRLVVDGDHLVAGADGEERLRGGRRERDDRVGLLLERDGAVVGLDRDGEVRGSRRRLDRGRRGGRRGRRGGGIVVSAARGEDEGEQDSREGCEGTVEHVSPSARGTISGERQVF